MIEYKLYIYLGGTVMSILETIQKIIEKVLVDMGISQSLDFKVEVPPQDDLGDFSTNAAFLCSKILRKSPKLVADEISEKLRQHETFVRVDNINGFINMFLNHGVYQMACAGIISNPRNIGKSNIGNGENIQFEFVSPNPTGPLTIAHGRQAVIGDVLCNIFDESGYNVQRELYINDAGQQVEYLSKSVWIRYNELLGIKYELPEDGYHGEYIIDVAKEFKNEYGEKYKDIWNGEVNDFFKEYSLKKMLAMIKQTLKRLGVNFDVYFSEKLLIKEKIVSKILDTLEKSDSTYAKDDAVWFKVSKYIEENDKVLIRSTDNRATYFCDDIAYHYYKYHRGFTKVYDIWGADHQGHIPRMKASMKALGIPDDFFNVILHQFVTLKKGDEVVRMSKRAGNFVTLDDLIEEVGTDATRYFFAMIDPDTPMNFDLELAVKKSSDNPVFYVQYAHARISSILKQAEERKIDFKMFEGLSEVKEKEELLLIKELSLFSNVVAEAAKNKKTNFITTYLEKVSSRFHTFYTKHSILNTENPQLIQARLNICLATKIILERGLALLGVSAPEKM